MEEDLRREEGNEPWRVLEFYSGIGGMRYSLIKSGVSAVVEAFDINNVANDVYQHNFHHRPYQGNIQSLSAAGLDSYEADAWLLSPPCQPYTRQGLQKGSEDACASSFLTILELIPLSSKPPHLLFVENVVGFETSDTHQKMTEILAKADFVLQEFILSPLQFGLPYSRPRYFCLNLDIVYPDSKRCCFTKSYYRYIKGAGSLLASVQGQSEDKASALKEQQLRYFTPREVANLHSFPNEFEFPKCISLRQRYALLGNSLSVAVVGPLLRYLFSILHDRKLIMRHV